MSSAQPRAIWGTKRLVLGSAERLPASAAEGASKPSPSSGRGLASDGGVDLLAPQRP
jgi:hypothetical protein